MKGIEGFFDDLGRDETLVFTTFTLDEAVLLQLLKSQHVLLTQRIIVFHDIMRHRNPGLLKSHYPNVMVYTVILKQIYKRRCPVFHSKLWARVTGDVVNQFIVTSANLSQYHLVRRMASGTLESFYSIDAGHISCSQLGVLFNRKLLCPNDLLMRKGNKRLMVEPHSWVIDVRQGVLVREAKEPLIMVLQALGTPALCAAPFVRDSAIKAHLKPKMSFKVYDGINAKTGLNLHAKVMLFPSCMALGSVNWTAQAMGCDSKQLKRPVNHETLLITHRDKTVIGQLRGFQERLLGSQGIEAPGDEDTEDEIGVDWLVERQARINAPEQALLTIRKSGACIRLEGKFCKVRYVQLQSRVTNDILVLPLSKSRTIDEPNNEKERRLFAEIIGGGSVLLAGLVDGSDKPSWRTELDYQEYWPALEEDRKSGPKGPATGVSRVPRSKAITRYEDVRDIRQRVISSAEFAAALVTFNQWLHSRGMHVSPVPSWCLELASQLQEGDFR